MNLIKLIIFFTLIPAFLYGQNSNGNAPDPEIGIVEKLDSYLPDDILLVSELGDTLSTGELIHKPTVLNLVYYRCPGICSPLMDGLAEVIKKSDMEIGKDYQILTVSFNPREGTALAMRKKTNYMNVLDLDFADEGWTFYTSDSANIARLTESVGFRYKRTGNDFIHTGTLIFLSPDRKITRYLNGTRFLPFEFKMAVIETSKGRSGPTLNKVLQYCYSYNPEGQQYVLNITRVAGAIITFVLLIIFVSLILRSLKKKKARS
ncbi:MAG: SCO family protein [Bacteroidales bacterium]|jgi:protein SCO1/2